MTLANVVKKKACISKSHRPAVVVECEKCPTKQIIQTVSIVVVRRGINHTHNSLTRMWIVHLCLSLGNSAAVLCCEQVGEKFRVSQIDK